MADRLATRVRADHVEVDPGGRGGTRNHLHTWGWCLGAAQRNAWIVVLEDDALPVNNFREELEAALAVAPTPVVGLYLGTGSPAHLQSRFASAIVRATDDVSWFLADRLHHAVGVAIRGHLVADMLGCIDARRPIDEAISAWCVRRDHKVGYTWPSLVDHLDGEPVIAGRRRAPRRRRAWRVGVRRTWTGTAVAL
ncbi:hypothetical protein AB431_17640 [Mycobacterium sp. EPa45]|nr:hypothetical protein AB431_17640 [Mycobacterium sp. EPa45]